VKSPLRICFGLMFQNKQFFNHPNKAAAYDYVGSQFAEKKQAIFI